MKQRVGGGLFAGMIMLAASCASDPGASNMGEPSTGAMGGTSSPATGKAGSDGSAGPTMAANAGTGGTSTSMSGVSSAAGAKAAAGTAATAGASAANAGTGGAAMTATAGASAAAGMTGSAAAGSGAASGGCGTESFKAIYDSIFKNMTHNCTGALCHGREAAMAMPVGNLSLSSAAVAYMQLVKVSSDSMGCSGKTRVIPGDAAGSLLVQKLRGSTTMCGGVMPVGAEEIPEADLKRITDWINAGACDN